jgi:hypothetical protein
VTADRLKKAPNLNIASNRCVVARLITKKLRSQIDVITSMIKNFYAQLSHGANLLWDFLGARDQMVGGGKSEPPLGAVIC